MICEKTIRPWFMFGSSEKLGAYIIHDQIEIDTDHDMF